MEAKQELIEIIQSYYNQHNTVPTCKQLGVRTERFRWHFGSYAKALEAAGLPGRQPLPSQQTCAREGCNNTFRPRERVRKFCSQSCAGKSSSTGRRWSEEAKQKLRRTTDAKRLAFCRAYFKQCNECGSPFVSRTRTRSLCSDTCRSELTSKRAVNNPAFGGNRSRNFIIHTKPTGETYTLDSSWEKQLAVVLDSANVAWLRPKEPLLYEDGSGKTRRYFPDFYIPACGLYIDTKNPWRLKEDLDKLLRVAQQRNISLLIISDKNEIKLSRVTAYRAGLHVIGADGETRTHDVPEYETGAIAAMRRQRD